MTNFSSLARAQRAPRSLAALGLLLATAGAAQAQQFAPVSTYASGGTAPYGLATGDVNGDGRPDLVTINSTSFTVAVLLGSSSTPGTFGAPTTYASGGSGGTAGAISVALGDVNGDGRLDVVATNTTNSTVGVLLNSATTPGTFGPAVVYSTGSSGPRVVALGDVNGDGRLDIATAAFDNNFLSILLNSATTPGTFGAPANYSTGGSGGTTGVALGDLNGDGRLDALALDRNTGSVSVFLNPAATPGSFGTPTKYSNGASSSASFGLTVGDLDGDGRPDVVTANLSSPTVSVLLNSATAPGTLQAAAVYGSGGSTPIEVAVGDVSGDGRADIVVTNFSSNQVGVLLNSTTAPGTFATAVTFGTGAGSAPRGLVLADLDADGRRDIATANLSSNTVGVLLNTSVVAAPTLTSLNPPSGPVGTSVTLTGTNLSSATGVSFNGTAATTFSVVNATTITATVPPGASTGNVTVTTGGGVSNGVLFTVAYPDLLVTTTTTIPAGTYNSITVQSGGNGTLGGDVVVNAAIVVQSGGRLADGCNLFTGSGTFTLQAGGSLDICRPRGILSGPNTGLGNIGAVRVTGARSYSNDASYSYSGNQSQDTGDGLPGQVRSLTVATANDLGLTNPLAVAQVLTLSGTGNLSTGGKALTLLSSSAGTALLVNSGSGVVSGAATIQRYIDPSLNPSTAANPGGKGYRHYSAPVANTTVADLTTANFAPVLTQGYNTSATPGTTTPFPNVFGYDQSRLATVSSNYSAFDKGWVVPAAASTPLAVGQGYAVNIAGTELVDFVGTPNTGTYAVNLSRNSGTTAADAGWNLVGNPYPAPLDYSQLQFGDLTGADRAMYVQQSTGQYAGQYRSYVNGNSTNPLPLAVSDPLIAAGQGFFVRVSSGQTSGTITFRNYQRVTSYGQQSAFNRTAADVRPSVRLELAGAGLADGFVAYAEAGATASFDREYDAAKLPNPSGLNLSSAGSPDNLAIDGRAAFTAATALPLVVGVPAAGTYTLTAAALHNLPAGLEAYLRDAATGQTVKLGVGTPYSFSVTATQATALLVGRFTLQFSPVAPLATAASLSTADVTVYPNPAHGRFTVLVPAVATAPAVQAELLNTLGQVVRQQAAALPATGATLTVETAGLAAGIYTLRLRAGATTLAKRVVIQ